MALMTAPALPPRRAVARPTWRFALLPALTVAVLTLVLLAFQQRLLGDELIERSLVRSQQRADVLGLQLQLALRDSVSQVRILARSPLLRPGTPLERVRAELDHLVERSPRFVWVGLVSPEGQVIAGTRGWLEGQSISQRPVFKRGIDGMVGDVHEAVALAPLMAQLPGGATELIDIGEPVLNEAGEVVGVITAHLGLGWVREQMALSLGEPEAAAAQGLQALVVTEPGARSVLPGRTVPTGLPAASAPAQPWQTPDGGRWLTAQSPLRGLNGGEAPLLPWRAIVLQSEDAALSPLRELAHSMLWVGAIAALLLAAAGFWAARRLLTPWDPIFDAVLAGQDPDMRRVGSRVQAIVAQRTQPTPTEMLMGWLAHDAGNLRRAIDHLPVAIALADRHYRYEYVNPAYTRLLGWATDAVRGRLVGEPMVDAAERDALARQYQFLGDPPGEFVSRKEALTPTGDTVAVQCHLVPMFDNQGRQVGALQVVHDIRAERSARVQADAMAGRLRALADAALDTLLATLDIDGRVLEWSRGAEALIGRTATDAVGRRLHELLPGADDCCEWLRCARIEGRCDITLQGGGERRFEGAIYGLGMAPGSARFGLILRDASDHFAQVQAQAELAETARDELTRFNRRLLEQERRSGRKLAQSLHDEVGQSLAALRLHWEGYRNAGAEQREALNERIAHLVTQANRQLRGVLAELRPPLLDELGLAAAIDNEVRQHQAAGAETRIELLAGESAQMQRWPADVEYAAFMVAREALLNALRHAGAQRITVRLDGDEGLLELSIEDDGGGLVAADGAAAAGASGPHAHSGLVGMRERALAVGAEPHIQSRPGHGTMVNLTWMPTDEPHLPD